MTTPELDGSARWIRFIPNPVYGHRHTPAITPIKQTTIRCVARWCDRYEFWPVGHTSEIRMGVLPRDSDKRDRELAKLYAWVSGWLQRSPLAGYEFVGVLLYSDDRVILDMHDGDLGHLVLTQAQADELGFCWQRFRLPSDLYIPESTSPDDA
jgi:hypothetical protein